MPKLIIPITKNARKYGYIIWATRLDEDVRNLLKNVSTVELNFKGTNFGIKNVDWKYRRISIGYRWTRQLPEDITSYVLTFNKQNNNLIVECQ